MIINKMRALALGLVVGCATAPVVTTASAQTYQCGTSADDKTVGLQSFVVSVVTGTDSTAPGLRTAYNLPTTTASKVSIVTKATTCRTAAQHFFASFSRPVPTSGTILVRLLQVGSSRYVVEAEGITAGEFSPTLTFDGKWHLLANNVS